MRFFLFLLLLYLFGSLVFANNIRRTMKLLLLEIPEANFRVAAAPALIVKELIFISILLHPAYNFLCKF